MNLQVLFAVIPGLREQVSPAVEVTRICQDARKAIPGAVFVAIPGTKADGHDFIPQAIENGAVALVVSRPEKVPASFRGFVLNVPKTRPLLDLLAARFFHDPSKEMFCVGVTGTNGKTSITYMTEAIFTNAKWACGVIGTVNHHLGSQVWPSELTTPDSIFLQERLHEFRDAGARAVAMEVSSHALDQRRTDSVNYDTVVFTNLTRDHLDYHSSMQNYFLAKQRLFLDLLWRTPKFPATAIVNVEDSWGRRLRIADPARLWTYGQKEADFIYKILSQDFGRTLFELKTPKGSQTVEIPMSGKHNVQNAVAAIAVGMSAGIDLGVCAQALMNFAGVPGRLQILPNNSNLSVFIDYAHSPDALENVLLALREVRTLNKSNARIWTVFGCGGDRDKGKRPLMGAIATQLSEEVIITSDNPRTEDPQQILNEISAGVASPNPNVRMILDRREAIREALQKANPGDVVLIAGKGHEDYQIIGTEKKPFSDYEIARQFLQEKTR